MIKTKVKHPNIKRVNKMSMNELMKKLKIDETFTKLQHKEKIFNHIINNIPLKPNYNFMADLLPLPTTSKGNKWLLTVVDMATNKFDMEPMKNKEALTATKAIKNIFKRKILKIPYASLRTDNGNEFKGSFDNYLVSNEILHKFALPYRHKQMSLVENLNSSLSRILLGYCNMKTIELNKEFNDWDNILDLVRKELNVLRERDIKHYIQSEFQPFKAGLPKYKVGDFVHFKLDKPRDAMNKDINDIRFRNGDVRYSVESKKIVQVVARNDPPYWRYILNDMPNVSYSEAELIPSKNRQETYLVNKIVGKQIINGGTQYKVRWKGYTKNYDTWEPAEQLIEDGLVDHIKAFETELREKQKNKSRK